ncbi:hypothetical protein VXR69_06300 [Acinetobacter baumannii]|uniref:hypothetical protein n=1 Tax=Acinetobacter baumannii TaxID=470 RepID=UPI003A83A698
MAQQIVIEVPGTKISELEKTSSVSRGDVTPVVQGETTKQADIGQISDFVKSELGTAALKNESDFATPAAVAEAAAASQARDDAQNERIDATEYGLVAIGNGADKSFSTYAQMLVYVPPEPNVTVRNNDPDPTLKGTYIWTGTQYVEGYDPLDSSIAYTDVKVKQVDEKVFDTLGKNLFDKAKVVSGEYYSPSQKKILTSSSYRRSGFIPVIAGQIYSLSGNKSSAVNIAWYETADKNALAISHTTEKVAQVAPVNANFAVFNLTHTGANDASYDATCQFELGEQVTAYEPYSKKINQKQISGLEQNLNEKINKTEIIELVSFNLINPLQINYTHRYSTGTKSFVTDALLIAATGFIPVKEGEWYTLSGSAKFGTVSGSGQGGFFASSTDSVAIDNISFVAPVSGNGHAFKVPVGLGIKYAVLSVKKTSTNNLDGVIQLEVGEMPTDYQEYAEKTLIKEDLIPKFNSGGGVELKLNDEAWFKYARAEGQSISPEKLPVFRKHMLLKDKDVCVVMTGTSLTARTSEHCTLRADAALRPPMMHSNAFCSHIWDAIMWEGQQYRRYDAGYFSETGAFLTASNLQEWDDGAYRDGVTRYSNDEVSSVQFKIPVDAWQFNFIYRADSLGCDAKISVAEGIEKVQVFDEATQSWIEAHEYIFSQLEPIPVTREVAIPDPVTGVISNYTLASKGNTTYQKRLKMRCRNNDGSFNSLATVKNVSIARVGGGSRFLYWGVEWSPRQYMITYINSSRGSHNTNATGKSGLPRFQDNEVWSFKPDLIFSELAIHNDGAASAASHPVGRWAGLTHNYVTNNDYELSLFSRSTYFNLHPEYAFFMGTITLNFLGINEDGTLKFGIQSASVKGAAKSMSALDKYEEAVQFLKENAPEIVVINTAKRWVEAGVAIFGDMKTATEGSGKTGSTFTNEGSHWNDSGSLIIAKATQALFG